MKTKFILFASIFMMIGVIMGAFGAHALKETLGSHGLDIWKTAVFYQFIHALAILALASHVDHFGKRQSGYILGLFILGTLLFSGSLFVLSISANPMIRSIMGPLTPLGGLSFVIGWVFVILAILRKSGRRSPHQQGN